MVYEANLEYSSTERTAGTLRLWRGELGAPSLVTYTQARTGNGPVMVLCVDRKSESDSFCMSAERVNFYLDAHNPSTHVGENRATTVSLVHYLSATICLLLMQTK